MTDTAILDADLPLVDAHFHLWNDGRPRYLAEEYFDDINASGHNFVATIYADCRSMYRAAGPEMLRPVGEVEFARGCAAIGESGVYGKTRICAGIVGYADLCLGDKVRDVLEQQIEAGGGRFRGIRYILASDPDVMIQAPPDVMRNPQFRAGFRCLGALGLTFDAWLYHPQLDEFHDFALGHPDVPIVLNHVGGLIGIGRYATRRDDAFSEWRTSLRKLARLPNVSIKLGGFPMPVFGLAFQGRKPHSVEQFAAEIRVIVDACIDIFGTKRCIFESNFPVNRDVCSFRDTWNAYKLVAAGFSTDEKVDLFGRNALRFYDIMLDPVP